ncbi:MAG: hypothetical protein U0174_20615 [Polyangiaceae bacterium]
MAQTSRFGYSAEVVNDKPANPPVATLAGEYLRDERGPVATAFLAVSGILPALALLELVARLALKYRRSATATYDGHAFVMETHTELLGKTLRKERWFAGSDVLLRRQERHPQLALYVGIGAVLVGSYWGIRLVWDGVRSASLSVVAFGILFLVAGLALDYVLLHFAPKGRVRFCLALTNVKKTARIGVASEAEVDAFTKAVMATRHHAHAPVDEAPKAHRESHEAAPATAHPEAP